MDQEKIRQILADLSKMDRRQMDEALRDMGLTAKDGTDDDSLRVAFRSRLEEMEEMLAAPAETDPVDETLDMMLKAAAEAEATTPDDADLEQVDEADLRAALAEVAEAPTGATEEAGAGLPPPPQTEVGTGASILPPEEIDHLLSLTTAAAPDPLAERARDLDRREAHLNSFQQTMTDRENFLNGRFEELYQIRDALGQTHAQLRKDITDAVTTVAREITETITAARAEDNKAADNRRKNEKALAGAREAIRTAEFRGIIHRSVGIAVIIVGIVLALAVYVLVPISSSEEIAPRSGVGELSKETPERKKIEKSKLTAPGGAQEVKPPAGGGTEQKAPASKTITRRF